MGGTRGRVKDEYFYHSTCSEAIGVQFAYQVQCNVVVS